MRKVTVILLAFALIMGSLGVTYTSAWAAERGVTVSAVPTVPVAPALPAPTVPPGLPVPAVAANIMDIDEAEEGEEIVLTDIGEVDQLNVTAEGLGSLTISGNSTIGSIVVVADGVTLTVGEGVSVAELEVVGDDVTLVIEGTVDELTVTGNDADLTIADSAEISELTVSGENIALDNQGEIEFLLVDREVRQSFEMEGYRAEEMRLITVREDGTVASSPLRIAGLQTAGQVTPAAAARAPGVVRETGPPTTWGTAPPPRTPSRSRSRNRRPSTTAPAATFEWARAYQWNSEIRTIGPDAGAISFIVVELEGNTTQSTAATPSSANLHRFLVNGTVQEFHRHTIDGRVQYRLAVRGVVPNVGFVVQVSQQS